MFNKFFTLLFLLAWNPISKTHAQTVIYYVDGTKTDNSGAGTTWATAKKDVQPAIDAAYAATATIKQVWVKAGTYVPTKDFFGNTAPANQRDKTIYLKSGVKLFGGFAGSETAFNQRNIVAFPTILSGDIGVQNNNTDNCYNVLFCSYANTSTSIDGFTIKGGNADGISNVYVDGQMIYENNGGGMSISSSSPTINNCIFTNNWAETGGGIAVYYANSNPLISNCTFSQNVAGSWGGGISNGPTSGSTTTIINCDFLENTANSENLGGDGGAISNYSNLNVSNCSFFNNGSLIVGKGGAIYNFGGGSATSTITNCTFAGNKAVEGGAINNFDYYSASPHQLDITNCSFTGNTTNYNGSGITNRYFSLTINNSILYGDTGTGTEITNYGTNSTVTISNSDVQQASGVYPGVGNINSNPLFVDAANPNGPDGIPGTSDDGIRVQCSSPTRDAGDNNLIPLGITTDILGNTRIMNATVDMGAYEGLPNPSIVYVDGAKANNSGNGLSWATAKKDVQAGINLAAASACTGKQVWVKKGTYFPTDYPVAELNDARDKAIYVKDGVKLYGGFAGTETNLSQRNFYTNTTILSGDIGIANDSTDNSYHVVLCVSAGNTTAIDGFVINNGNANGSASITVAGKTIERNNGGGIYNSASSPAFANNTITRNTATNGAMYNNSSSSPAIVNCTFSRNSTTWGGGINNRASSPAITNCTFIRNSSTFGGGIYNIGSSPTIANCTFYGNAIPNLGHGILNLGSSPTIANCILFGDTGTGNEIDNITFFVSSNPIVSYSLVQGGYTGTGNINADPLFINATDPDGTDNIPGTADDGLILEPCSPAINAGSNSLLPAGITTDITGAARIQASTVDMGAYEGSTGFIAKPVYVDINRPDNLGDGFSWATAKKDVQTAIDLAATSLCANKQVWVKKGIYQNALSQSIIMKDGVEIYGGFLGNETLLSQRNYSSNPTILQGNNSRVINNDGNILTATAILDGFTIKGGIKSGSGNGGAGLYNFNSSPAINNCIFTGNTGGTLGGAIYNNLASPTFTNCMFSGNTAISAAGMYNNQSSPNIINCTFNSNTSTFTSAGSNGTGGGIYNYNASSPIITNCVFAGNIAKYGAGIANINSTPTITNCTFTGNTSGYLGRAMYNQGATITITNCILFGNLGTGSEIDFFSGNVIAYNCIVQGGFATGTGNMGADPLFVEPGNLLGADGIAGTADDGLRLNACSPAINAGTTPSPEIPTDILGNGRVSAYDIGAYEYQSTPNAAISLSNSNYSQTLIQGNTTIYGLCANLITTVVSKGASPISGSTAAKVWVETTQPAQFVKRHYEITPVANAAAATGGVTLYFTDAEFNAFNTQTPAPALPLPISTESVALQTAHKANLRIEKRGGTSSNNTGLPDTYSGTLVTIDPDDNNIIWIASAGRWEVTFDVTGFSGFFVKTQAAALPLQWLNVSGKLSANRQATIYWQVQEINVAKYDIEKSVDGINFSSIGNVSSKGWGINKYEFTDPAILTNFAYYRIKETDVDGKYNYSSIIKLNPNNKSRTFIYPNPTKDLVTISGAKIGSKLMLTDMGGKILQQMVVMQNSFTIDLSNYASGVYLIKTEDEVQKIIKE